MEIIHFTAGQRMERLTALQQMPDGGTVWLDFVREEAHGWEQEVQRLTGVTIDPNHVQDAHNAAHPSFCDGTPDYDMFIFQGLGPETEPFPLDTRTAAFYLFDRLIVSVRAVDDVSFDIAREKIRDGRVKVPSSPLSLMHLVLDTMVDRYLAIREPLARKISEIQDGLLDPDSPGGDWKQLMRDRRTLGKLGNLCGSQLEAVDTFRRQTRSPWSPKHTVRMRDLEEHIQRVLNHVLGLERDIESAIQLHFSAVAHSTNQIINRLTVISAVFLPLSLLAGIWGMNFVYMPETQLRYGYFMALGVLASIGVGLLVAFKRRGFF